jgi:hypothetical protein
MAGCRGRPCREAALRRRRRRAFLAVWPKASAADWARQLASSEMWWPGSGKSASRRAMKSQGWSAALMEELVERVLAVGAGLAPENRAGRGTDRIRRRGRPACRCSPSRVAAGRPATRPATGCRAARLRSTRRGNSVFHRLSRASVSGRLSAGAASMKCCPWRGRRPAVLEMAPADGQGQRRPMADHSEKRPPTQSQNSKTLSAGCRIAGQLKIGRDGDEVAGDGAFAAGRREQPGARGAGVGQRFQRGEGLAGDDEQGGARVEAGEQRGDVGAVDIGDEMHLEVRLLLAASACAAMRGPRSEPPMPILTTSVMRSPAKPRQLPLWMLSQNCCMRSSTARTSGGSLLVGAQGHVADGAAFGVVDRLAGAHAFQPAASRRLGELAQQGRFRP